MRVGCRSRRLDFRNTRITPSILDILLSSFSMARYGEGDRRWIVEERPDGTNVHNWHWAETDCLEWSKNHLSKLLSDMTILDGKGNLFIKTTKLEKAEGEAYVNIRKGKIIPGYELSVTISWQGEAKDSKGKRLLLADGSVEIPYISEENADENPEIRVSVKDEGPIGKRLKDAMLANGVSMIQDKIRDYVQCMAKGGPAKDEMGIKKAVPKDQCLTILPAVTQAAVDFVKKGANTTRKRITFVEEFCCSAKHLYKMLMDEKIWKCFTQSDATISSEIGGEFSIFNGAVTGRNVELKEGELIVQVWRFDNWADGVDSTVKLEFCETEVGKKTDVKLTHTDIPEEDRYGNATVVDNTEKGWKLHIFDKLRTFIVYAS